MSFENAQNRFRLLSGLSEDECEHWSSVLNESLDYVQGIVTKKELSDADERRLGTLAGVLAYCKYMIYSIEAGSGYRAGEITVNADNDTYKNAQSIWQNELRLNSDLVGESRYIFRAVKP